MFIRNLSPDQIQRLIKAIESDGFNNVQYVGESYISFNKSPRSFELYELDVDSHFNNDDFNIYLDEANLFSNAKKNLNAINTFNIKKDDDKKKEALNLEIQKKVRHSVSLSQKDESDTERAINEISGWKLVEAYYFQTNDGRYFSIPDKSDEFFVINIKGKEHFALNNGKIKRKAMESDVVDPEYMDNLSVYEGSPDIFLSLVMSHPESFFDAPNLRKTIMEIKEEVSNQS